MDRELLEKPFEESQIKRRKGPGGRTFEYLETATIIKRLNEIFGGHWSFEVAEVIPSESEAIVKGTLTASGISKQQFGNKQRLKNSLLGDSLKSATSDALKKCASLIGIGLFHDDTPEPAPNNDNRLSQEQSKQIYALSDELEWKPKILQENIKKRFDKSLHELTSEQAQKVIEGMEKAKQEAENEPTDTTS